MRKIFSWLWYWCWHNDETLIRYGNITWGKSVTGYYEDYQCDKCKRIRRVES